MKIKSDIEKSLHIWITIIGMLPNECIHVILSTLIYTIKFNLGAVTMLGNVTGLGREKCRFI